MLRIGPAGFIGGPVVDVATGYDRAQSAVLVGSPPTMLAVGDRAILNLAQVAVLKAFDPATFARIPNWGGQPFGVPSAFGGLVAGGGALEASGFAPGAGTGSDDIFDVVISTVSGQTTGAPANLTNSPEEDQANASVFTTAGAVTVGKANDVPVAVRPDAAGSPSPSPTTTPAPAADLRAKVHVASSLVENQRPVVVAAATNEGPQPAVGVKIDLTIPSILRVAIAPPECAVTAQGLRCTVPAALAPEDSYSVLIRTEPRSTGGQDSVSGVVAATVSADRPADPVPYDNYDQKEFTVYDPVAEIVRLRAAGKRASLFGESASLSERAAVAGRAAITKVEVALRRKAGGRCLWLRSPRGATKKGKCGKPVWLKARGIARWQFRARHLAPGKWVALARATNAAGVSTAAFSSKRRNERSFRIRSRR